MPRKGFIVLIIIVLLATNVACQFSGATAPTATPEPSATMVPTDTVEPTATPDQAATEEAQANEQATQEAEIAATEEAQEATQEAKDAMARTAAVEEQATAQANDMFRLIEKLNSEGNLKGMQGDYYAVEDFDESWAQINWYQWWRTGLSPANFVLRARTEWESASRTANWFSSGCGFVFREEDASNHYIIFLALDGNVYLSGSVDGEYRSMGSGYYGKLDFMQGSADIVLVVEGSRIQYFVNGQQVLDRQNETFAEGALGLTLLSGTNKDFGTRCKISDVEVWDMTNYEQ